MSFKTVTFLAGLLAAPAMADFKIFVLQVNNPMLGRADNALALFNNEPNCKDVENSRFYWNPRNDATVKGTWACDGCDGGKNMQDWDIERLELPHHNEWSSEDPGVPFTIYQTSEGGDHYDITDGDGEWWGDCYRVVKEKDPQYVECVYGAEHRSGYHLFNCVNTDIVAEDTN